MSQQFEKLMEPGQIGPVKTRNRIIKTANGTSFMDFDTQGRATGWLPTMNGSPRAAWAT